MEAKYKSLSLVLIALGWFILELLSKQYKISIFALALFLVAFWMHLNKKTGWHKMEQALKH
jgi:uncharacterized membrane protein YfcA